MAFKKKQYDDDDGRVIADMSDIQRQPMFIPRFDHLHKSERRDMKEPEERAQNRPEYEVQYTEEERRALIGGTVTAALLIGAVFIVAIGLLIFLITKIG
ncbi:MAG: hypothetical protein IKI86_06290 [Firmicutes bacterium]|nr:hypothetical protein [Bacillota bacterium]MBR4024873.1 hypothetical protein [Bacillota bacterium]